MDTNTKTKAIKLTAFDVHLYSVLRGLEQSNPAVIYCDEITGEQYVPIQYLYFLLPRKYWKTNIETTTQNSMLKLEKIGLAKHKEIGTDIVWRSTTPTEIVKIKKQAR
jgi:hypothetical protein